MPSTSKLTYNGISIELETWVSYNLQDAVIEVSDNFAQEIPIAKLPIVGVPGIGLEVGMGLGLFTEGDTEVSFDLTAARPASPQRAEFSNRRASAACPKNPS